MHQIDVGDRTTALPARPTLSARKTAGGRKPLLSPLEPQHQAFRERLRAALAPWEDLAEDWEVDGHLPREIFAVLGEAGVFRDRWAPGRTGGLPFAVVIAEETARVSYGLGLAVTLHSEVFTGLLSRLARSPEQIVLRDQALAGHAIGCFAITEPTGGSDVAAVRTRARRTSDGWELHGEKRYTSNAGRASHVALLANLEGFPANRDLGLFVVPLDAPGVEITGFYPKVGTNSCDAAHVVLQTRVGPDALLGTPGLGLLYVMQSLELERIAVSAQLVLASRTAVRLAVGYLRRREQFSRRLSEMQALRHRLADMTARVWAAESFLAGVVLAALDGRDVSHETAALKLTCASTAAFSVDESLQMFGGRGYTANYPLERMWRDVRLARIGAGTDEVMRELIASAVDRPDAEVDAVLDFLEAHDVPCPVSQGGEIGEASGIR